MNRDTVLESLETGFPFPSSSQVSAATVPPRSTSPVAADTAPPKFVSYVSYGFGALRFEGATQQEANAKATAWMDRNSYSPDAVGGGV